MLNNLKNSKYAKKLESNIFTIKTENFDYDNILTNLIQSNNCYLSINSTDLESFFHTTNYSVENKLSNEIIFLKKGIDLDELINDLLYIGGWLLFGSKYDTDQIKTILNESDFHFEAYPLSSTILANSMKKYKIDFFIASFWDDCEWTIVLGFKGGNGMNGMNNLTIN